MRHFIVIACISAVAPFVGAWIEISLCCVVLGTAHVAPFVGAWIEIAEKKRLNIVYGGRSVRRSVD